MEKYTKEDIYRMIEEEDIEFIRLQFTDRNGLLKNIAVTTSQLERVLNNEIMFDGASIDGIAPVEESDMLLYPDLDTFCIIPWRPQQGKVARFLCNIHYADGTAFLADPRYILKKTVDEAKQMGFELQVAPECEFFLFHSDDEGKPTTITHENAGYFDVGPQDYGENARRDMIFALEDMGFVVESSHHEGAPAQHEIDIQHMEALQMADGIMTFRLAVKAIAKRHGLHASFMPKPKPEYYGSGMHLNMALLQDGRNVFYDPEKKDHLSETGLYFIGGLFQHISAITAITNPTVNSYKRLVPGFEAPVYIAWSARNRSPLIRVPAAIGGTQRIELRSPDSSANPYLAIAVCLAAGMDGIRNKIMPPESVDLNIQRMTEEEREEANIRCLPENLMEAVRALEQDPFIRRVLGEKLTDQFIKQKKKEWADYSAYVTNWEIDHYLAKI